MKQKFSTNWKGSKQPRKQRKYGYNAPLHLRHKKLAVTLSKELRKKHGCRNLEVRKGDTVKVMRGKFKKKQGKVLTVSLVKGKISIDGLQASKRDGSKVSVWFEPSNVRIVLLDLDDQKRLKRKKKTETKQESKDAPKKN